MKTMNTILERAVAKTSDGQEIAASLRYDTSEEIALPSVVVGTIEAVNDQSLWINFAANLDARPIVARSCVSLSSLRVGMRVTLAFENGDAAKPIVIGLLHGAGAGEPCPKPPLIEMDGERLIFNAQKEVVLRCGKASIQLLSDGSVRIRGAEVLTRASGTNRIRGGNVQIN